MRLFSSIVAILAILGLVAQSGQAEARQEDLRRTINQGTVSIISGGIDGTYIRIAADLANVLDSGNDLRVLPIVGKGSVQNITDILYLKGTDIGIVQSDVLAYMEKTGIHPGLNQRIRYIAKLYNEEFHLLANGDVGTVEDLAGKKVNFGPEGSGTHMTASTVFDILGVAVEHTSYDYALALEKLLAGEIDAIVYVAGKPTDFFKKIPANKGLRLIPLAHTDELLKTYLPSGFSDADYPNLVVKDGNVETIAVGAVMAVYNWKPNKTRHDKVAAFVDAFFSNFEKFLESPRHKKWQEVNLAADVPGWTRFDAAEEWLNKRKKEIAALSDPGLREAFESFLRFIDEEQPSEADRADLFAKFIEWRER